MASSHGSLLPSERLTRATSSFLFLYSHFQFFSLDARITDSRNRVDIRVHTMSAQLTGHGNPTRFAAAKMKCKYRCVALRCRPVHNCPRSEFEVNEIRYRDAAR